MTRAAQRWVACFLLILVLGTPAGAEAHTGFQSGTPGPHDHLDELPAAAQLEFGQPAIPDQRTRLAVLSPSGVNLARGPVYSSAMGVATRLRPSRETGRYSLSFAVVSVDGHLTEGRYPFWVVAGSAASSRPGNAVTQGLLWLLGVLTALVVVGVRLRRRARRPGRTSSRVGADLLAERFGEHDDAEERKGDEVYGGAPQADRT